MKVHSAKGWTFEAVQRLLKLWCCSGPVPPATRDDHMKMPGFRTLPVAELPSDKELLTMRAQWDEWPGCRPSC